MLSKEEHINQLRSELETATLCESTYQTIKKLIAYFEQEQTPSWSIYNKMPHDELAKIILKGTFDLVQSYTTRKGMSFIEDSSTNSCYEASSALVFTTILITYRKLSSASEVPGAPINPEVFMGIALIEMGIALILEAILMTTFLALAVAFPPLIPISLAATSLCFTLAMSIAAWFSSYPTSLSLMIKDVADAIEHEDNCNRLVNDINEIECSEAVMSYRNQINNICFEDMTLVESIDVLNDVKAILSSEDTEVGVALKKKYSPSTGIASFFTPVPERPALNALMCSLIDTHDVNPREDIDYRL